MKLLRSLQRGSYAGSAESVSGNSARRGTSAAATDGGRRRTRLKRPRPAAPDQVRITREGETAVIEYADPSVRVVNLQVGPSLAEMTDAEVLELFNDMLEAQAEIAACVDPTLTEIPPDLPQMEYNVPAPAGRAVTSTDR